MLIQWLWLQVLSLNVSLGEEEFEAIIMVMEDIITIPMVVILILELTTLIQVLNIRILISPSHKEVKVKVNPIGLLVRSVEKMAT